MTDNPRINRYLKDKAFDHIDHALGRYFDPTGETHRNYFATEVGGTYASEFDASPYWSKSGQQGDMAYYHVTAEGKAALKAHLAENSPVSLFEVSFEGYCEAVPAQSARKAKYDYWVGLRDAFCDLAFIDFARTARVRRLA